MKEEKRGMYVVIGEPLFSCVNRFLGSVLGEAATDDGKKRESCLRMSVSVWISGSMVSKHCSSGLQVTESFTNFPWENTG